MKLKPLGIASRAIVFLLVFVFLNLTSSNLFAGRVVLSIGSILRQNLTIVLATVQDVKEVESDRVDSLGKKFTGFSFRLDFEEIIRPGEMKPTVEKFEVPFSQSGYATNWEFGAKPINGMKVMAFLKKAESGEFELHNFAGGINVLEDFDQPIVKDIREICKLWEIGIPAEQLKIVIAGCRGDGAIQSYCSQALSDLDGGRTGLNLAGVIDQKLADSILFEPFASKKPVSLSKFQSCEQRFWNKFRGRGWELYEPRYDLLSRSVDKVIADGELDHHNTFDSMIMRLCRYPAHAQENYQRLMKVVYGKVDDYKFGTAMRFSLIYQPHTTDPEMQALNDEIFDSLLKMISDNGDLADGASIAMGDIAESYAKVGPVPEKFMKILKGETDFEIPARSRGRLNNALRVVESAKPPKLDDDVVVLSYPWDDSVGKKVFVSANNCFEDGQHGASAKFRGQRLWIDGLERWPEGFRSNDHVQLTGRLTRVNDLPVFRYEVGQAFKTGLPVPEGYSLEKAATRYVLMEPTWKAVKEE